MRLAARVSHSECPAEQACRPHSHPASETRCKSAAEQECGRARAQPSQSAAGRVRVQSSRDHTVYGSSNKFREVGIELRRPLQNTCSHRSSASSRARLAACCSAQPASWKTHTVKLRSIMIMSSRDLLCVVLEILGLIFIVTVCIVLAAPIELHPVGAFHDTDTCPKSTLVPQCTWKQSDKYRILLLWVLTKLLVQSIISFLCNMARIHRSSCIQSAPSMMRIPAENPHL
jgi:hypothetical protein